ncbi:MAG: hypothetical protein AAFX93_19340 [Verrucomicrobiota bacterium]
MSKDRAPGAVVSDALMAYSDLQEWQALAADLRQTAEVAIEDRDAWKARYEALEAAVVSQARFVGSVGSAINKNATLAAKERVARFNEADDEPSDEDLDYCNRLAQDPEYNKSWDELVSESVKVIQG